ncbi:Homeodomain-like superfamily protein [Tripterygium wilfordii]|uniref:Homeodomain-like superfamily protein n=1 Tax=Tripterygium wilfordii TaxID=458696 RepID=A0A7J7DDN6_TRIWF|nr:protein REVEILLE 6-like isoform X2 [Tripterygium wilfordii]KAF5744389.1 Homeodomain-like superfamily protein [Tripterygium wilfordii]
MVSVNPNPVQGFYFFDPVATAHSGVHSVTPPATVTALAETTTTAASYSDDVNKKVRKPYTITKSRESWTEQEHEKFLEALQLFDRDWKKIEAFVSSKNVIQIRSHAQKYFLKVQKSGTSEHVPPPRPKRKAAHPYPHKAPKNAMVVSQHRGSYQSSSAMLEPGYMHRPDSSIVIGDPVKSAAFSSWSSNSSSPMVVSQGTKDDVGLGVSTVAYKCCDGNSRSTPRTHQNGEAIDHEDHGKPVRVMPDFAQVYSFIGSVFDPNASGQLQRLKQMDPINLETVLLLMRNLSVNLTSSDFEDHKKLLESYDAEAEAKTGGPFNSICINNSERAIPAV